ncbi:hypothetical protein KIN20_030735 [Parelaphostrongylus tenuis]|uniref:Uncharacterized protein n=1 Tax=Parelaphostrongylus tenuis TaxID=148309 RepID=A0AAD5R475_PARTN|nr:hypothetical protein KIN20_030735 [Parelaphostrongylus tenuis]
MSLDEGFQTLGRSVLASSAEEEVGDETDDSTENNTLVTDAGSSKASLPRTLPFDADKQVLKQRDAYMQGAGQLLSTPVNRPLGADWSVGKYL